MALNHEVNGSPVEVKHINYGTSVGYTKVGSPTISNGVVSGFLSYPTQDYLQISNTLDTSQDLEIVIKAKNEENTGVSDSMVFSMDNGDTLWCSFTNNSFRATVGNETLTNLDYSWPADTWRYFRIRKQGSTTTLDYSTDGVNYIDPQTSTSMPWPSPAVNAVCKFGIALNVTSGAFKGSVDLNESYIKVNGKLWFFRPSTNYLVKDNKLVFADSGLYLSGPNTYTVTGSPTIVDGVANQFSTTSYLKIDKLPQQVIQNFKIKIVGANNGYVNNNYSGYLYRNSTLSSAGDFVVYDYVEQNKNTYTTWCRFANYDDPENITTTQTQISDRLTVGDKHTIIIECINGTATAYLYDSNNQLLKTTVLGFTVGLPVSSTYDVVLGRRSTTGYCTGYIDLNQTYIEINGSLWFYGKNYASQNIAPVPSEYTYGATTTTGIGWVDMRTQQFTEAPTGATLGKDE